MASKEMYEALAELNKAKAVTATSKEKELALAAKVKSLRGSTTRRKK
jgi:hypothetical protein